MFNFNPFQKVIRLNTISKQEAEELAAWEFIHPHSESAWDKLEREQENLECFALGIHEYDHNGKMIDSPSDNTAIAL